MEPPSKNYKSGKKSGRSVSDTVAPVQRISGSRRRFPGIVVPVILFVVIAILAIARAQSGDPVPTPTVSPSVVSLTPLPSTPVMKTPAINPSIWAFDLGLVLFFIFLNGAFAMAETSLVALRRSRVEQLVEEGRRGADSVKTLTENPPRFIATVQVGITLLGFAAAAIAATSLSIPLIPVLERIPGVSFHVAQFIAEAILTLLIALVSMVLGEIAPKSLALQAPDFWALRLAPLVKTCSYLFAPIIALVVWLSNLIVMPFGVKAKFATPMITKEELEQIIDQGAQQNELDDEEAKILTNVFDLSETMVRSVMTPRTDLSALSVDATLDKTLETIIASGHSRIPVYDGTIDNIIGIVHAKDLLPLFKSDTHDINLRRVMRPPHFIPETKTVSELLAEMRRSQHQLAIVQDEYAGTAGLVTIEDLVEEIVGDIRDEYDVDEPEVQVLSESESLIDGRMSIADVNERLGMELPDEDYDTIGGLVFGLLGHSPSEGESVLQDGTEFRVEQVQGRRIRLIRAVKAGSVDGDDFRNVSTMSELAEQS